MQWHLHKQQLNTWQQPHTIACHVAQRRQLHHVHRHSTRCWAGSKEPSAQRVQLPIFPLSVVALPSATVPLMIFEPRYRVLFNTLLYGEDSVEEGLVQKDSPFCGSKTFGMCFVNESGQLATVGTTLVVQEHLQLPDGRLYVTSKGAQRFKIAKVLKEAPVLICEVEMLPDELEQMDLERAKVLAEEVSDMFRNTLRLHMKMMQGKPGRAASGPGALAGPGTGGNVSGGAMDTATEEQLEPEELTELNPQQLSFWLVSAFQDSKLTQQALLEESSTLLRLEHIKQVLGSTLKFYSAASALSSVFSSSGSENAADQAQPPPGGPD